MGDRRTTRNFSEFLLRIFITRVLVWMVLHLPFRKTHTNILGISTGALHEHIISSSQLLAHKP